MRGRDWFSRRGAERRSVTFLAEPEPEQQQQLQQLLEIFTGRASHAQRMRGGVNVRGGGGVTGWSEEKQPEQEQPEQLEPEQLEQEQPEQEQPEPEQLEPEQLEQEQPE